ncbi:MAG: hypothetical protein JWM57_83, partial [Phycisphaerales bacterium]|nr:hypothetical protein [Phycisphaerales bacterium]
MRFPLPAVVGIFLIGVAGCIPYSAQRGADL